MSILKVLGAALGATLLVTFAQAMTITNRDSSDYTVVIQKGDEAVEHMLGAGATVEDVCDEGCIVRLADADAEEGVEANTGDRFAIEDGELMRDAE